MTYTSLHLLKIEDTRRGMGMTSIDLVFCAGQDSDVFEILRGQEPGAGGEIQLADAINKMATTGCVASIALVGRRFDCGSVRGYLDATLAVADRRQRRLAL